MAQKLNTLNIVMDEELEKKIKKIAEDQRRSVSAQICFALEEWLEERK